MLIPLLFLERLFFRKSVLFSGNTLLLYDYLITFPLEIQYIWKAPLTAVKAGFLANRYGNVIGQTFVMLEETGYLGLGSEEFCMFFRLFCTVFMVFSAESIRILVLMRAWAIWGCQYGVAVFSITLYILYVLAVVAATIYSQVAAESILHEYLALVDVCVSLIPPYLWLIWLATLVLDSIVLAMVWYSLRKLFNESRDIYPSPLIRLLVRDAVLFYAASVFNDVISIICWTVFRQDPRYYLQLGQAQNIVSTFGYLIMLLCGRISYPLLSVIGQRLILNLRGFQARRFTKGDISREVDKQIAAMDDLLWLDLGANDEQANLEQSDNSDTIRTTGTTVDPALYC